MCKPKMPPNGGPGNFTFHHSRSASGPWLPVTVAMDYPCFSENLTPSAFFHPNGTMFIVFHCDSDATHTMCDLVMVRSTAGWRGPFERVNDKVWSTAGVGPHRELSLRRHRNADSAPSLSHLPSNLRATRLPTIDPTA